MARLLYFIIDTNLLPIYGLHWWYDTNLACMHAVDCDEIFPLINKIHCNCHCDYLINVRTADIYSIISMPILHYLTVNSKCQPQCLLGTSTKLYTHQISDYQTDLHILPVGIKLQHLSERQDNDLKSI